MLADGFAKLFVEVINVPEVGKVMFVVPVVVKVNELAPEVIRLPPKVIVLVPLLTPVPPLAEGKTPAVGGNPLNNFHCTLYKPSAIGNIPEVAATGVWAEGSIVERK